MSLTAIADKIYRRPFDGRTENATVEHPDRRNLDQSAIALFIGHTEHAIVFETDLPLEYIKVTLPYTPCPSDVRPEIETMTFEIAFLVSLRTTTVRFTKKVTP